MSAAAKPPVTDTVDKEKTVIVPTNGGAIAAMLKAAGPQGAVLIGIILYLFEVHLPKSDERFDRVLAQFRTDSIEARKDFLDGLKEERTAHSNAVEKLVSAIAAMNDRRAPK